MMDLVVKIPQVQAFFVAKQQPFESGVGGDRQQPVKHEVENQMHRMRGDHEMDENSAKIKHMFHRMHRQPRPRANIGVAVMQGMEPI